MGVHYNRADFITYGRPSLFLDFVNKKSLTDRISGNNLITFGRTSIGTYVGADGLIKSATTNEARFDHNPVTGESLGLLIEGSRYNICSYSEDFSNSYWSSPTTSSGGTFTITSNSETSPDGTLTADKCVMQVGATSVNYQYWYIKNSGYSPNGTDRWIWSFYVKSAGAPIITIGGQHGGDRQWTFNLSTGLPVSNYGTTGDSYQYMGNGWYRLSLGWVPTLSAYGSPGVNFGCSGVTGDGNVGIYMWGAQLEKGDFLTFYIPTPSTTVVTRNADSAIISGTNFSSWFNTSQGTFFINYKSTSPSNERMLNFGTGATSTIISNEGVIGSGLYFSGIGNISGSAADGVKVSTTTSVSESAGSFDGNTAVSTGACSYYAGATSLNFIPEVGGAPIKQNWIKQVSYYPTRLTNAQLQNLTR